MRKIIIAVILLIVSTGAYSQDLITRSNGEIIKCKIQNEDSTFVYFKTFVKGNLIETRVLKSEVSSIKYDRSNYENGKNENENKEIVTKAIGVGLDYGGIVGFKLAFNLNENFELFGGLGWVFAGFGYNVGIKLNIPSELNINPFIQGMYGYNTVIIDNYTDDSKVFYGATFGFGLDFKSSKRKSYWTLGIQVPIRDEEVDVYVEEENLDLYPVTISVGYTF